jgi:hypothetical protein
MALMKRMLEAGYVTLRQYWLLAERVGEKGRHFYMICALQDV